MEAKNNFIAIEGTIGAGKTSLAHMLAKRYGAKLLLEGFEENEFLPKFYKNPDRYAFQTEMAFLAERYHQLNYGSTEPDLFHQTTVSDYFLSKSLIFASVNLKDDEYRLFRRLFDLMFKAITKPDLLIYLYHSVDKLRENIDKRGRSYEKSIAEDYLDSLQKTYLEFLKNECKDLNIIILDISSIDFVKDASSFQKMVNIIEEPRANRLIEVVV
jgi:deoxyadenosine/deoxycytidine kinase